MSMEEVKQGVEQGSALFEDLPVNDIAAGWEKLDLEVVKEKVYEAVLAVRGLQETLTGMLPPIGAVSRGAEHGNLQLQIASEGTENFDMLDVLASAELTVQANLKLGTGITAMERLTADMVNALIGATLSLGNVAKIYEQVASERLPETIATAPAQVVKHAREYVLEH